MWRFAYGEACRGPGWRRKQTREFSYTSRLQLAMKWSISLYTYYPPLSAHAEYDGGM